MLCNRLVVQASKLLLTNLLFQQLNFTLYIYTIIYPYVKAELKAYKQTFEYQKRLEHAMAIATAAFFYNLQDSAQVSFDLHGFYKYLLNNRMIVITDEQFAAQVEELSRVDVFNSQIKAKAPAFDDLFSLIKSKPLIDRYFHALGIASAADMVRKFARKDQDGNMQIKVADLYKQIQSGVNQEIGSRVDYMQLLRTNALQVSLVLNAILRQPGEQSFVAESQSHIQSITLPKMQTLLPPRIKTEYLSYRVNSEAYPDPRELYPHMFYRKYCPKASYAVSESKDVDAAH